MVDNQVFSHWTGCDAVSGVHLNTCNTTTSSAFKQATAIYTNTDSRIVNISTRAYVGTGENVVILGFIISGGDKNVRIRGVGSSLETSGIRNCLKDPYLTLYKGSAAIAGDDDSVLSPQPPHASTQEAELNVTLAPGAYTAILQAAPKAMATAACPESGPNTGIGLVSVEDQDPASSPSRLVNISTRAYSDLEGTSQQAIAGFILSGTGKKRVLIKGAGPVLTKYGIVQALQDPIVGFFSGATKTYSLDNWRTDSHFNTVLTVNGTPLEDAESGFLMELSPGAYTVHMGASLAGQAQGKTVGVGLISMDEDKGVTASAPSGGDASTTVYKRGVQCETTTYTLAGQKNNAPAFQTCPGMVSAVCGASDLKIYSVAVPASDLMSNVFAGWSTTLPSCN
jgi:hypothetical protein